MDKQSIRFEIYGQLNFLSHPLNEKLQRSRDCARSFSLIRKPLFDGQVWCFKWLNNHVKNIQISLIYLYRRTLSSDALKLKQAMHFNGTSFIERVTYTQIAQAKAIHLEKRKKVIHWFDDTFRWKVHPKVHTYSCSFFLQILLQSQFKIEICTSPFDDNLKMCHFYKIFSIN